MSEVNIPLLRKAVEWAEAEAAKPVTQSQWYQPQWVATAKEIGRDCGTCYCIAGYVAQSLDARYADESWPDGEVSASTRARDALGLTFEQSDDLFWGDNTIEDVRRIAEDIAGERL